MKILLDSHVLLWSLRDPLRIKASTRAVMADPDTSFVISVATVWELAIKQSLGHLTAPPDLPERIRQIGHEILPVNPEHAWQVRLLPPHHKDPFDRLLVAQAQVEGLPLVTHDHALERYDVAIIRA